jgi:hypothetical protein
MARTHIIHVVGATSRFGRRTVIPDDDGEIPGIIARLAPGEEAVQIPISSIPANPFTGLVTRGDGSIDGDLRQDTLAPIVAQITGKPGPATPSTGPGRTLLQIDPVANKVVAAFMGETAIDKPLVATHLLTQSDTGGIGWTYNPTSHTLTSPPVAPTPQNPTPPSPTVVTLGPIVTNTGTISISGAAS